MRRSECVAWLDGAFNDEVITVTSLSGTAVEWARQRERGANFYGWNLGLCTPFAAGLALALPQRRVVALDSDGSLLLDPGALITIADVGPSNLLIIVFDNEAYGRMGPTATATVADLEGIARASGIRSTGTARTLEEFQALVSSALSNPGPTLIIAKVEFVQVTGLPPGSYLDARPPHKRDGRPVKEAFVRELMDQGLLRSQGASDRALIKRPGRGRSGSL